MPADRQKAETMSTHENERHPDFGHVAPLKALFGTFGALLVLTVATYGATYIDLGPLNIWIALGIAVIKGSLVAMFFMHLWWDGKFNAFILICGLLYVMIFIGIAMLDSAQYQAELIPGYAPAIHP